MGIDAMIFAINNIKCFWCHRKSFLHNNVPDNLKDDLYNKCMQKLSTMDNFDISEINYLLDINLKYSKNETTTFWLNKIKEFTNIVCGDDLFFIVDDTGDFDFGDTYYDIKNYEEIDIK